MLRELAIEYKSRKNVLNKKEQNSDKPENNARFQSFLNSFLANVPIFTAVLYNSDYHTNCNIHVIQTIQTKSFSNEHSYAKNKSI